MDYVTRLGLIDKNETAEEAAIRELREETGYVGEVGTSSTLLYNDPGLSNAVSYLGAMTFVVLIHLQNMKVIQVEVDMSKPENKNPEPHLDKGEQIETFTVPLDSLHEELQQLDKQGFTIDARLSHFALGVSLGLQAAR